MTGWDKSRFYIASRMLQMRSGFLENFPQLRLELTSSIEAALALL